MQKFSVCRQRCDHQRGANSEGHVGPHPGRRSLARRRQMGQSGRVPTGEDGGHDEGGPRSVPAVRRRTQELHRAEVRADGDEAGDVPPAHQVQDPSLPSHSRQFCLILFSSTFRQWTHFFLPDFKNLQEKKCFHCQKAFR